MLRLERVGSDSAKGVQRNCAKPRCHLRRVGYPTQFAVTRGRAWVFCRSSAVSPSPTWTPTFTKPGATARDSRISSGCLAVLQTEGQNLPVLAQTWRNPFSPSNPIESIILLNKRAVAVIVLVLSQGTQWLNSFIPDP